MRDEQLETIALITIILGLTILFFVALNYEKKDAHYLFEDDNNAYLEGTIKRKNHNEETKWTYLEIESCRTIKAFHEGNIEKQTEDTIKIQGTYYNEAFTIKKYE